MHKLSAIFIPLAAVSIALTGCTNHANQGLPTSGNQQSPAFVSPIPSVAPTLSSSPMPTPSSTSATTANPQTSKPAQQTQAPDAIEVIAHPESITVLVNKHFSLPSSYNPAGLVYPEVPFVFPEKSERRMMRKEAASALERMFAGAKADGIELAGVSAYRSYETQKVLFDNYVKKDGLAKARTYSALPGTSEHETGLAIDVSGISGKCAATACFAATKEAKWLVKHAAEYGFIVRYLQGKESITGYMYEPWHLRYVGTEIANEIMSKGITLEEYLKNGTLS